MKLQLSSDDAAFQQRMRTFFTTEVPQEIRDLIAAGRHLSQRPERRDAASSQRHTTSRSRTGRPSGAAKTGAAAAAHLARRRCSSPACRLRWRSTPTWSAR
ncbi:MAG: hypothetical protein WKF83_06325 [Nocardioidaceae bacterium]